MIRLSPTAVLKYENCPYQYLLEEVLRIRPVHKAANLVVGKVLHRTVEDWLRGELTGAAPDPVASFDREWTAARNAGGVEYAATQSPESLTATGRALASGFASAWPTFQRLLAVDGQGAPLLELKLEVQLGPRLVYVGRSDLLTFTSEGELECLDLKTPSTPTDPEWLVRADQITGYQLLLDAHAERLGLPPVERLGLLELVKRKMPTKTGKGPEVLAPITVPRRSATEMTDYAQKVRWVAEDIERGRFPKRGLM
ncbi:MAG TPA: PD-(D/E)XK nuclease family protein, partial [Candidatus Competibacter phosphatis]|nr:PD-(D/E)XK nuclease family protein [Candidatus Competibacter phosphatis]